MEKFQKELEGLINSHSIENECDVPDFLLAEMIVNFIHGIGNPIKKTLDWHGCDSVCHPKPNQSLEPTARDGGLPAALCPQERNYDLYPYPLY